MIKYFADISICQVHSEYLETCILSFLRTVRIRVYTRSSFQNMVYVLETDAQSPLLGVQNTYALNTTFMSPLDFENPTSS